MIFKRFLVESSRNFAYLIGDEQSREAAVIDPSGALKEIFDALQEEELKLKYIFNTHSHPDHTTGNKELATKTGAKIAKHEAAFSSGDIILQDGDIIELGTVKIRTIYTPGHAPDSICLLADNKLLTGDTLFVGECGKTDLPGGSSEKLYDTLEVYPGHDYGVKPDSTLGFEKTHNYVLKPRTKQEFIRFMNE
jgi:hydroxyacylglutathione hydrolase